MSALDQVLAIPIVVDEHPRLFASATAELAQLRADLNEANENIVLMVKQYFRQHDTYPSTPTKYSHNFIPVGEVVFEYLTSRGLAKWCKNGEDIFDLQWPSAQEPK